MEHTLTPSQASHAVMRLRRPPVAGMTQHWAGPPLSQGRASWTTIQGNNFLILRCAPYMRPYAASWKSLRNCYHSPSETNNILLDYHWRITRARQLPRFSLSGDWYSLLPGGCGAGVNTVGVGWGGAAPSP